MKYFIVTVCMFFGLLLSGMAQTATSKADDKAVKEAQKKADKEKRKLIRKPQKWLQNQQVSTRMVNQTCV